MNREQWLNALTDELRKDFDSVGYTIPEKVRMACGWTSKGSKRQSRTHISECWSSECSADNHHEIFISPLISDSVEVGATLVHELIHATIGLDKKHGKEFGKAARVLGLDGKMTATVAGEELIERLNALIDKLGAYPHADLSPTSNGQKKQSTRLIKAICPDCGYTARVANKWLDVGLPVCPCGTEMIKDV